MSKEKENKPSKNPKRAVNEVEGTVKPIVVKESKPIAKKVFMIREDGSLGWV